MGGKHPKKLPGVADPLRDVDEELRYHLESRTDELSATGMSREDARRTAEEEFGDLDFTRTYCAAQDSAAERGTGPIRLLGSVGDDVRSAFRRIARRPRSVAAPVVVLAGALALNILVFSVVRGVLLAPLPLVDEERAFVLEEQQDGGGLVRVSYPVLSAWAEGASGFERISGYLDNAYPLVDAGSASRAPGAAVTHGFFDLLDAPFLFGTGFAAGDHTPDAPRTVVISEGLWRRAFGGRSDMVGQTINLAGSPRRVSAVVRHDAVFPDEVDVWVPLESEHAELMEIAGAKILLGIGTLRPGADVDAASEELAALSRSVPGGAPAARITSLRERLVGDVRRPLLLLQGAVLLVLLTACANAGGMLLTRSVRRQGELAVRRSLGASGWRVGRLVLLEGLLIGGGAGVLGVAAALAFLPSALRLVPPGVPRIHAIGPDPMVVVAGLSLALLTGLVTGAVPYLSAIRIPTTRALREADGRGGVSRWFGRLQDGFVIGQVALATVLTVGAGLLGRSFMETITEDAGFDSGRLTLVDVSLPAGRYPEATDRLTFAAELLREAEGLPGVDAAALGRNLPVSGSNMTSPLMVEGRGTTDAVQIAQVSGAYFDIMGIPLIEGSTFAAEDRTGGAAVLVIDETLRREAALDIGAQARSFFGSSGPRDVIGVAGAVRHGGLRSTPEAVAYEPFFQTGGASSFTLLVRSTAPAGVVAEGVRELLTRLDSEIPTDRVTTMRERVSLSLAGPRFYAVGLMLFGILAVLLALAGCQAALAQRVAGRRRELGLRLALGATLSTVRGSVVRRGVVLTMLGALMGVAMAIPATRVLESQLYGVGRTDPLTYGVMVLVLLAAAVVASDLPARRAASVDPAVVLRGD